MNLSHPSKLCSLENLIHGLSIPATKNSSYYDQLIQSLDIHLDNIDPYCTWNERSYTRNLVHSTDLYELLILCWHKGQASPIHDHQSQDCWIYVVEGTIEETLYQPTLDHDQHFILRETDRITYHQGISSLLQRLLWVTWKM
ncbi:cysteine dioxygenase [Coleofasciculus sp. F4-SAH-05]|uniref:cysteine dioxygenase n=1 Tax=Coleofasciculus sp. F4-SAH-05 TaxID=3069525 RepID=UPI0032F4966C